MPFGFFLINMAAPAVNIVSRDISTLHHLPMHDRPGGDLLPIAANGHNWTYVGWAPLCPPYELALPRQVLKAYRTSAAPTGTCSRPGRRTWSRRGRSAPTTPPRGRAG